MTSSISIRRALPTERQFDQQKNISIFLRCSQSSLCDHVFFLHLGSVITETHSAMHACSAHFEHSIRFSTCLHFRKRQNCVVFSFSCPFALVSAFLLLLLLLIVFIALQNVEYFRWFSLCALLKNQQHIVFICGGIYEWKIEYASLWYVLASRANEMLLQTVTDRTLLSSAHSQF